MTARLEIYSPNVPGKVAIIEESTSLSLSALSELGGVVNEGLENGVLSISKDSVQPRQYTLTTAAGDRETAAVLDYFRILQANGDASIPVGQQMGQLHLRDFNYQINDIESGFYRRTIPTGSTTEVVGTETLRCGVEMPVYILYPEQIKSLLGNYGETFEITFIERVNALPSEVTTQVDKTIRVAYSTEFSIDFLSLPNPYIRIPVESPEILYSIRQTHSIRQPADGDFKQQWQIENAEITLDQLKDLRSMLSRWRGNGGNLTLTDLSSEIAESVPRTRQIATGFSEEIINSTTRYFGAFNVGQVGPLSVSPKQGDSEKVLVSITFSELGGSA
ncbi:MAG: hypothetical protein AAGA46_00335 [Cyanobacteria bacterium P01_F01_bin.13]